MALRWFLQAATAMIIDKPSDDHVDPTMKKKKTEDLVKVKNVRYEGFRMPLHYPRYKKEDYERMDECKLDMLLREYGLEVEAPLEEKKSFAMGAFLWPNQS
ncbi:hypothetical protein HPP92_007597 [Vanilla planifolia]|uniref:DUF7722 domain-containing protein n=1 Tax=Vanilla planifolia TaxID=51239 RepID=A0A835V7V3_VANPL|nr:hypothetical protein HPP92_007597 [Vanilla planifolia]